MSIKIVEVEAIPLSARFADIFGGLDKVPPSLLHPAAHYQTVPRYGQFSTIVKITASDGTVGIGEAWGLPLPGPAATIVNEIYRPMLLGQPPETISSLWESLYFQAERIGNTRGFMMEALSGVDIALWDLQAKRDSKPLYALLGGQLHEYIDCYASPVRFTETPGEAVELAQDFVRQGFGAVKVKAGRSVDRDVTQIVALREALGPQIKILVDFNCGYTVQQTIDFAREVEQFDIYWLEEPLPPENIEDLAIIRKTINIPLCTGENEFSLNQFRQILKRGAVDVINPNVTRAGGITGIVRINAVAQSFSTDIALHGVGAGLMLAASLHLMSTFSNSRLFEYNQLLNPLRDKLVRPAPGFKAGSLQVPTGAGLGVELDGKVITNYI